MNDPRQINQSELFELLGQLKNKKVEYPDELLAARRAGFIAQINAIPTIPQGGQGGSGGSGGAGSSGSSGGLGGSTIPGASAHAIETVLGYVLAGAVTILAGTVAYVYQDEIRDLINPPAPTVEIIDSEAPTPTPVSTPISTDTEIPTPTIIITTATPPAGDEETTSSQAEPTNTNPGLHLGQTKTPKPSKPPK